MKTWILLLAISWSLVGLIWVIQLVHYPSFKFISAAEFSTFHQHHNRSITSIVMPLMLLELGLSFWFVIKNGWSLSFIFPLGIVIAIWLSTFLIQVPLHASLANGKEILVLKKLVMTNWFRTILWTLKAIWVSILFLRV